MACNAETPLYHDVIVKQSADQRVDLLVKLDALKLRRCGCYSKQTLHKIISWSPKKLLSLFFRTIMRLQHTGNRLTSSVFGPPLFARLNDIHIYRSSHNIYGKYISIPSVSYLFFLVFVAKKFCNRSQSYLSLYFYRILYLWKKLSRFYNQNYFQRWLKVFVYNASCF